MFLDLDVGSSLSQTADVTPVQLYTFQATVTPELYGLAVQLSQKLSLTSFTDVEGAAVEELARSAARTREKLAREAVIAGVMVLFGGDAASRLTVSTAATSDVITFDKFNEAVQILEGHCPKIPGAGNGYAAIVSGLTEAQLMSTGAILLAAEYNTNQALLTGEIGTHLSGTRLLRSDMAKQYRGGGPLAITATGSVGAGAITPGSTSIPLNAAVTTSGTIGDYIVLGTAETTGADYGATTEVVRIVSGTTGASGAFGIVGAGVNGGTMYAHSSGDAAQSAADIQGTVVVGADSLGMVYSNEDGLGPEGKIILPEVTGTLKQFNNVGWSGFWGFGISAESRVVRIEHAVNYRSLGH
jgi:N4-gp56 family major capsid protein